MAKKKKYEPRLKAPSTSNKYWKTKSSGGYNKCISISGSSVLPNCFSGDTPVLTDNGIMNIQSCVGGHYKVLNCNCDWVDARFENFGKQQLYEVSLGKHIYYATANHRWLIYSQHNNFKEIVETKDLKPGMNIAYTCSNEISYEEDKEAIKHGFIFGDGCYGYKNRTTSALLCGNKKIYMARFFERLKQYNYSNGTIEVPYQLKEGKTLPNIHKNKKYLYNFLKGYFAADGSVDKDGSTINITCKYEETLLSVRDMFNVLEIRTGEVKTKLTSGYTGIRPLSELSIYKTCLKDDFFLNPLHRERFMKKSKKIIKSTTVKSVNVSERIEDVYCAIEPETNSFTLGGGEITGNCVGYAYGRFMEITGKKSCKLSTHNARDWYPNKLDGYARGKTPKVGAVMCWTDSGQGQGGHVAIVEKVHSSNHVTCSESAYGGKRFYVQDRYNDNGKWGFRNSNWKFQGFIYNPSADNSSPLSGSESSRDSSSSSQGGTVDPRNVINVNSMTPYIAHLGKNQTKVDYKKLKEMGVSGVMIYGGGYYDSDHKEKKDYIAKHVEEQTRGVDKAKLFYALYVDVRARSVEEAQKECSQLYYLLTLYPPELGIWLKLDLGKIKKTNNKIINYYLNRFMQWGVAARRNFGIYATKDQLKRISWKSKWCDDFALWLIDPVDKVSKFKGKLLEPTFFKV